MAVTSRHLTSRLQLRNMTDDVFQTMHRVRPSLDAFAVEILRDSVSTISVHPAMSAALTISEELIEE